MTNSDIFEVLGYHRVHQTFKYGVDQVNKYTPITRRTDRTGHDGVIGEKKK
jgi:hypothetical protein